VAVKRARAETLPLLRGVHLYTPFDASFIDRLKALVPQDLRTWDRDLGAWYVFETYAEQAVALARSYWPDIDLSHYGPPRRESQGFTYSGNARTWREQQERARRERERQDQQRREQAETFHRRQQAGWQNTASVQRASSDHATLFVTADAPPEVIRAAYKALALLYHPDKGGSVTKMQALNSAMDALRKAGKA
jgi:hypothetical protein